MNKPLFWTGLSLIIFQILFLSGIGLIYYIDWSFLSIQLIQLIILGIVIVMINIIAFLCMLIGVNQ